MGGRGQCMVSVVSPQPTTQPSRPCLVPPGQDMFVLLQTLQMLWSNRELQQVSTWASGAWPPASVGQPVGMFWWPRVGGKSLPEA